jgi:hypothetical protein
MKHLKSISELGRDQKPMIEGIIDILLQVKDMQNRLEIAKDQIKIFKKEDINFNYEEFLKKCGLDD